MSATTVRTEPQDVADLIADLIADLPERDLTPQELHDLVDRLAARPDLWGHLADYDDEHRHYVSLHRDAHVDVWLLCWTPANDTGWHDHDVSAGAVAVASGALAEHALVLGDAPRERVVEAGSSYGFGPDHIHRMTGHGPRSVSVHAYSPPLWRMGQYAVEDGVLRRVSRSYADELRPVDEPVAQ